MKFATFMEVWDSPEFEAFCIRFGINREVPTQDILIRLPVRGVMTVVQQYLPKGEDINPIELFVGNSK